MIPGSADRRLRAVPIDGRGPDGQYHRQHPRRQLQAGGAPSGDEGRRRRRHEDLSGAAAHCYGRFFRRFSRVPTNPYYLLMIIDQHNIRYALY